ncbi:MAG: hypothetical protein ABII07_00685 [Patescibacteria group bacterium]|nr:type II toxin-antitoxin system RelB/DinJ family antitoxin [Patescibacteria group bacterium]
MTAIINIKTDPKIKAQAQKIAKELGFSLSGILNAYLRDFVRTKKVEVSLEPTHKLIKTLKECEKEYERGEYVSFDNLKDALNHLNQLKKKKK